MWKHAKMNRCCGLPLSREISQQRDISPLNMALGQAGMEELDEDRVRVGLGGVLWMGAYEYVLESASDRKI